jgi:hypothetical protein
VARLVEQEQDEELGRHEVMRATVVTTLFGAGVALACAAAWTFAWRAHSTSGPRPTAPVREEVERVPAMSGELTLADGRKLCVRVARLHAEAARQSFDAAALRERFALPAGEPFQCLVEVQATSAPGSADRGFDLREARIEDERGVALAAFPPATAGGTAGIVDPLAALVAPPSTRLFAENRVSLLMWGRAPGARARFETCCERPLDLLASDILSKEIQTTLARVRRPSGANETPALEAR